MARIICGFPLFTLAVWLAAAVALEAFAPDAARLSTLEPTSFLPPGEPVQVAEALECNEFPDLCARSRTVLIFERPTGLTPRDLAYLDGLTDTLVQRGVDRLGWRVISPTHQPYLRSRLTSQDGQAAMMVVYTQANWVTTAGRLDVERIVQAVQEFADRSGAPDGLATEITGQGGLGRDLGTAAEQALRRTTWITVSAVLIILLIVYRAPLAALIPVLSIGLTAFVTLRLLDLLAVAGWSAGAMEKTFAVVLIFGSGTDFAMFWIARYGELLEQGAARLQTGTSPSVRSGVAMNVTAGEATVAVAPAIIASAGTTVAGLLVLTAADFVPSASAGRVLAVALTLSLIAALTLVPAAACLMERALFWRPGGTSVVSSATGAEATKHRGWTAVARWVTAHPAGAVALPAVLLAWPVSAGLRITYRYDGLGVAPPGSSSERGQRIAETHFSAAQLYSWTCLVRSADGFGGIEEQDARVKVIADAIAGTNGVQDVWSLRDPLGRRGPLDVGSALIRGQARPFYVSADGTCLRFEVMPESAPFSTKAMRSCTQAMERAGAAARRVLGPGATVHAAGMTPYIINVKRVTDRDHARITVGVCGVILIVLMVWLRRLVMPIVMLGATLVVYYVTLGVAEWLFTGWLGAAGLDWKIRLIVFVILVTVGQDYNIFLISRIRQESAGRTPREAVARAIARTGSVISSCGVIMAATLGSLTAAPMSLYRELGFAFAFAILLDTFLVRPIIVPGLYLILRVNLDGRPPCVDPPSSPSA